MYNIAVILQIYCRGAAVVKIRSLGLKISLLVTLVIAIIIVLMVFIVNTETSNMVDDLVMNQAVTTMNVFWQSIESLESEAFRSAETIAHSAYVRAALETGDYSALRDSLLQYGSTLDVITLTDASGVVLARSHSDVRDDDLSGLRAVASTLSTGLGVRTLQVGVDVQLSALGSAAIIGDDGRVIGVVTCGYDLSLPKYVDDVKDLGDCEATIFVGDTRLSTTVVDDRGERRVGTQASSDIVETVIGRGEAVRSRIELFGRPFAVYYSPMVVDDETVGMLFTGINIEQTLANQRSKVQRMVVMSVIVGLVSVALIFLFCTLAVSRPLRRIAAFSNKIRIGELGLSSASDSAIAVHSSDEVGVLARTLEEAYLQLKGYIGEIEGRMNCLANGDLSSECSYEFQGDFRLIKDSINGIIGNLNATMSEIITATAQVAAGSKQIAEGAQTLAQGSTEQAASVQQLSSSIADIAQKTSGNSDMAGRAASLANKIMSDAEKGSRKMDEMTVAVKEINLASQNISRVIKVIDDIAFQTNILALNAAVEAARAGQHGKGFAVVAEEVRNLAAKSAEAARDTGGLIANSMEKAELGARIAGETAASLADIVSGIDESNQIVADIARSSEEQSVGIGQVNNGIDQVAQVVQQNSATAEESAAASQEMSGQSDVLEGLVSQFKLRDGGRALVGLPASK